MELKKLIIPFFASARHKPLALPGNPSELRLHSDQGTQAPPSGMWSHIVLHNKYCIWQSIVWSKE